MHLIPSRMPPPRLLSSAARDVSETLQPIDDSNVHFKLKGESLLFGNIRAILVGIAVGGILLWGAGALFDRYHGLKQDEMHVSKVLRVVTSGVSGPPHSNATPRPVIVQIDSDLLRVSAIVLGHPRLAVINGRSVAEGDNLVVHAPTRAVAITLHVLSISDGR